MTDQQIKKTGQKLANLTSQKTPEKKTGKLRLKNKNWQKTGE